MALRWGRDRVRGWTVIAGLAGGVAAATVALGRPAERDVFAILALQAVIPTLLLLGGRWFEKDGRYRPFGDSVFLLGAIPRLLA